MSEPGWELDGICDSNHHDPTLDETRDALAPLLVVGLGEMVMIDGVESYQITTRGEGVVGMAREMGVIPPKEDEDDGEQQIEG